MDIITLKERFFSKLNAKHYYLVSGQNVLSRTLEYVQFTSSAQKEKGQNTKQKSTFIKSYSINLR